MTTRMTRAAIAIVMLAMLAALTAVVPGTPSAGAQEAPAAPESAGDPDDLVGSDGSVVDVSATEAQLTADFVPGSEGTGAAAEVTGEPAPTIPPGTSSPTPGGPRGESAAESVIGPDGRTQVNPTTAYPDTAIGQITFTQYASNYICTGYLIDPNTVATSGHCVNYGGQGNDPGAWSYNVVFYPGRNGGTTPYTCNTVTAMYTTKGWLDDWDPDADFGFIQLGGSCSNIGNTVGWFGYFADTDANLLNQPATVRGYPGDKPSGTMWTMDDQIRVVQPERLYYQADTFGGQSGSPVFNITQFGGACGPCAMAVHSYGTGGTGPSLTNNSGPRITRARFIQFAAAAAANSCAHTFTDVPNWVDKAVNYVACLGLMEGFGNKFKPYDSITRAQVARVLYRIAGFPPTAGLPPHGFTDVPPWVEDAVKWLAANDYATGYGNKFRPDIPITRAAVTRMLFRIAGEPPGSPANTFSDVPDWVDDAVDWITDPDNVPPYATGFAGNKFKPLDDINRAQTTRMTCRINSLADCG